MTNKLDTIVSINGEDVCISEVISVYSDGENDMIHVFGELPEKIDWMSIEEILAVKPSLVNESILRSGDTLGDWLESL